VPLGMYKRGMSISLPNNKGSWISCSYNRSVAQQPDLTRVCHQVRDDTLPMFYGSNHFVLHGDYYGGASYRKWLRVIGPPNAALLRTVTLSLGVKPDTPSQREIIINGAEAIFQWLHSELGQHTKINAAWFQYDWPYLESVDILHTEPA
jgi:hypothetical protein